MLHVCNDDGFSRWMEATPSKDLGVRTFLKCYCMIWYIILGKKVHLSSKYLIRKFALTLTYRKMLCYYEPSQSKALG